MPIRARRITLALVGAVAAAVLSSGAPAHGAFPGNAARVAFDSDRDEAAREIYSLFPGGTAGLTRVTTSAGVDARPAYSPDGLFTAFESNRDGNLEIYYTGPNNPPVVRLTNSPGVDMEPAWSPGSFDLVFASNRHGNFELHTYSGTRLTNTPEDEVQPAWSPDGTTIAFVRSSDIYAMPAGGGAATNLTNTPTVSEQHPNWSPDGSQLAFDSDAGGDTEIYSMDADGTGATPLTDNAVADRQPAWAPDGTRIVFERAGDILTMLAEGGGEQTISGDSANDANPDWQPLTGHVRPLSASPLRVSLVPAFAQCTSPNREHGPPLAFPSCNPPVGSPVLTLGHPDSGIDGGSAVKSGGYVSFRVVVGTPGPPEDSDVVVKTEISDVRCRPGAPSEICASANLSGGSDYTGELRTSLPTRMTDRWNAVLPGGGVDRATVSDFDLGWDVTCAATADLTVGATCVSWTAFNGVVPGSVRDGKRDVRALGQITLFDGGPDGDGSTEEDNSRFAVQGVFVP